MGDHPIVDISAYVCVSDPSSIVVAAALNGAYRMAVPTEKEKIALAENKSATGTLYLYGGRC